jgi:hypothetical protein
MAYLFSSTGNPRANISLVLGASQPPVEVVDLQGCAFLIREVDG